MTRFQDLENIGSWRELVQWREGSKYKPAHQQCLEQLHNPLEPDMSKYDFEPLFVNPQNKHTNKLRVVISATRGLSFASVNISVRNSPGDHSFYSFIPRQNVNHVIPFIYITFTEPFHVPFFSDPSLPENLFFGKKKNPKGLLPTFRVYEHLDTFLPQHHDLKQARLVV